MDVDASSRRINDTESQVNPVTWYKWDLDWQFQHDRDSSKNL